MGGRKSGERHYNDERLNLTLTFTLFMLQIGNPSVDGQCLIEGDVNEEAK